MNANTMALFRDIQQFTRGATYCVDIGWQYLPSHYYLHVKEYGLDVYPDFQRSYVWTIEQKIRYVEYILRGGASGKDIYTNDPNWNRLVDGSKSYVLVDGRQRLDAVLGFLNNEFPIFGGSYRRDFSDSMRITTASFKWHVNDLPTRDEVLQWYVDLNSGGTIHSPDEIDRVKGLIGQEYKQPSQEEAIAHSRMDREIFLAVVKSAEERAAMIAWTPSPTKKAGKRR